MTLRAKVHTACLLIVVACEVQTYCVRQFAEFLDNTERRHAR